MGRTLLVAVLGLAGWLAATNAVEACGMCGDRLHRGIDVTVRGKLLKTSRPLPQDPGDPLDILRLRWGYEIDIDGTRYTVELDGTRYMHRVANELVGKMVVVSGKLRGTTLAANELMADDTKEYTGTLTLLAMSVHDTAWPPRTKPAPIRLWKLVGKKQTHLVVFGSSKTEAKAIKLDGKPVKVRARVRGSDLVVLSVEAIAAK